jgi:hypothetical protein
VTFDVYRTSKLTSDGQSIEASARRAQWARSLTDNRLGINHLCPPSRSRPGRDGAPQLGHVRIRLVDNRARVGEPPNFRPSVRHDVQSQSFARSRGGGRSIPHCFIPDSIRSTTVSITLTRA